MPARNELNFSEVVTAQLKTANSLDEVSSHTNNMLKELKSSRKAFEQLEVELAPQREALDAAAENSEYLRNIISTLDEIKALDGASSKEQKVGLARLSQIRKEIEQNSEIDKNTKDILLNYSARLDEGLKKQSSLLATINKTLYDNVDKITGGIAYALGNSPLGAMISGFLSNQVKAIFERRREAKNQKASLAKMKAIEAATKGVEKAVREKDRVTRSERARNAPRDSKGRFVKQVRTRRPSVGTKTKMILVAAIVGMVSLIGKAVGGILSPLGAAVTLVTGGVQALLGAISSLSTFLLGMIKNLGSGLARLLPGFKAPTAEKPSKIKKTTKKKTVPKQLSKAGKAVSKGGARAIGTRALGFLGAAGAVAGAAYTGWEIGTFLNDKLNAFVKDATGGKSKTFGDWLYDTTHKEEQRKALVKPTTDMTKRIAGAKAGAVRQSVKDVEAAKKEQERILREAPASMNTTVVQHSQAINQVIAPRIDPSNHDPSFIKQNLAAAT